MAMYMVANKRYFCLLLARIYTKTKTPPFLGDVVNKVVFSVVYSVGQYICIIFKALLIITNDKTI